MEKSYIVVNMTTSANFKFSYEAAVAEAKQKTAADVKGVNVYGVFELKAVTEVPIPDIKIIEVK